MRFLFSAVFLFLIELSQAQCFDIRGIPVVEIPAQINDVAKASLLPNGAPAIYFNPYVLQSLSPPTRLFFQYHECGHHALGHALGNANLYMEQQADCWAIRTLVANGLISQQDLMAIQMDIANFGVADWSHLPGPLRALNLPSCLSMPAPSIDSADDSQ